MNGVTVNEPKHYRGGFVWPIILIGAGIVFLLNNMGRLDWSVWNTLLRLWPVLLIAVGLDILVGRRFPLGSALLGLLLIVVLVLAVQGAIPQGVTAGSLTVDRTETVSEDLKGSQRATVDIKFGAGRLNVDALTEGSDQLVQGSLDLSRNESLTKNYSANNGVANLTLQSRGSFNMGLEVWGNADAKKWNISLNRDLPLDLRLDTGAGQSMLDLTNLNLTRLDMNGGVGQVTVKLPMRGRYSVEVDGGVGQVIIMVPQGLAAKVHVDGGLGGVNASGFSQQGSDYSTGNYNAAENRADIQVKGGVGEVVLKTLSE
jgi:hypothetical protein